MASEYASKVLGAALLQGWTMSAEECKREYCPGCPLMVSKDGKVSFCAKCDGGELVGLPRQGLVEPLATSLASKLNDQTRVSSPTSSRAGNDAEGDDDLYELQSGRETLPNTPPTPHSRLDTPPPLPPSLPALDSQAENARKAQRDRASALLAQNMLQGWTLLGEECSNESCNSVPLMRRPAFKLPKKDGEDNAPVTKLADPRRHCVICQRDYVREGDVPACDNFMAAVNGSKPSTSTAGSTTKRQDGDDDGTILHSAAAKKRRFSTQPPTSQVNTSRIMGFQNASADAKGKSRMVSDGRSESKAQLPTQARIVASSQKSLAAPPITASNFSSIDEHPGPRVGNARHVISSHSNPTSLSALENAVKTLSHHLTLLCGDTDGIDPAQIAEAAEALSKTCKSLEEVKTLYH